MRIGKELSIYRGSEAEAPQGQELSPQLSYIYTADIPKPNFPIDRSIRSREADYTAKLYQAWEQPTVIETVETQQQPIQLVCEMEITIT